jgi:ribosomal protein S18 acetylase RimI-like enzyme
MNIQIANPIPEDARGITTVLYKAWLATYPNDALGITIEDIEDRYKYSFSEENIKKSEEGLRNIPSNQKKVIAKDGDTVVGVATIIKNDTNNQLRMIYVLPQYQGKGVGTMLWNAVKDFTDPSKNTIVQVADYNQQAIKFYEKLGFIDTGKRWKDERWKMRSGAYMPEMEMILKK